MNKIYVCVNCGNEFNTPKTVEDVKNDEQYDLCPICLSDEIERK